LVSARSGIAELLIEKGGGIAASFVVDVSDDLTKDACAWRDAIESILTDRDAALERTRELRESLAHQLTWRAAADELVQAIHEYRGNSISAITPRISVHESVSIVASHHLDNPTESDIEEDGLGIAFGSVPNHHMELFRVTQDRRIEHRWYPETEPSEVEET